MTRTQIFNKELDEFRHHDIDNKLEIIYSRLWDMQGRLSAVEARSATIGGLVSLVVSSVIGAFFYMFQGN